MAFNVFLVVLTTISAFVSSSVFAAKRGLPFNNPSTYIKHWNGSQITWSYNWDYQIPGDFPGDYLAYVPMLHDPIRRLRGQIGRGEWANYCLDHRGSRFLFFFNEPDLQIINGQPNPAFMYPGDAAVWYRSEMMPFHNQGKANIGGPAVSSSSDGGAGLDWLSQFLAACWDCYFDFIPIHWYGSANDATGFISYVNYARSVVGNHAPSIWITEFHAAGSVDEQATSLRQVMSWMDSQPWIFRYAYFWANPDIGDGGPSIVDGNGWPTDLGNVYAYEHW